MSLYYLSLSLSASGKHVIPNQAAVSTIDPAHVEDRVGVY